MFDRIRKLSGHTYEHLNIIEISASRLNYNYNYLSSLNKNIKIAPVLKSNAYGHGLVQIAKIVDELNPPFICVDSLFEAYELLKANIKTQILIMGFISPQSLKTKKLPFSFVVFNKELVDAISKYQPHAKIHIFVDTGMHREGVNLDELPSFIKYIKIKTNLEIEGLMSHFAASDVPANPDTQKQVDNFQKAISIIKENGVNPKWIHIANSSGVLNNDYFKEKIGNMARIGISLYGTDPEGKNKNLKPVLSLKTHIAQIKKIKIGEKIGYDFTFTAKTNMTIGILPLGYNDGVQRELSNKGFVLVNGKYCRIIGKVSMNITTIDLSNIKNAKVGDTVIVYSNNAKDKNSIENTAKLCKIIPYESLIPLTPSTKRIIVI